MCWRIIPKQALRQVAPGQLESGVPDLSSKSSFPKCRQVARQAAQARWIKPHKWG
jgi:hypothetical protein